MKISELSKKYDIDKRTLDYYTNCELIPYETDPNNGYREYGEEAEDRVKIILILHEVGFSTKKIKEALENPSFFTKKMWDDHIALLNKKLKETEQRYADMIKFATDMRDTASYAIKYIGEFDDVKMIPLMVDKISVALHQFYDEEAFLEKLEDMPEDYGGLFNEIANLYKRLEQRKNQNLLPQSVEVQNSLEKFKNRIKGYFGTIVYIMIDFGKKINWDELNAVSEEEKTEYENFLKILDIIANWFRTTRSYEKIMSFEGYDDFDEDDKEHIAELDSQLNTSTRDDVVEGIKEIRNMAFEILKPDNSFLFGVKYGAESMVDNLNSDMTEEQVEQVKQNLQFMEEAINYYLESLRRQLNGQTEE